MCGWRVLGQQSAKGWGALPPAASAEGTLCPSTTDSSHPTQEELLPQGKLMN